MAAWIQAPPNAAGLIFRGHILNLNAPSSHRSKVCDSADKVSAGQDLTDSSKRQGIPSPTRALLRMEMRRDNAL